MQSESDRISRDRLKKLEAILSGDTTIALHLQFLIRTNKADLQILKNTKVMTSHIFLLQAGCFLLVTREYLAQRRPINRDHTVLKIIFSYKDHTFSKSMLRDF